jgi:phospholipase/carboxylesterase
MPETTAIHLSAEAVVWSVEPADRAEALATRPLLVLLHGRGSHERDLISLAPMLPSDAVIASLRAPMTLGDGYTWFPPAEPGLPHLDAATASANAVLEWLDGVGPAGPVSLMGFSQGGAMVTQLLRLAPQRFSAYVCLSGFSVPGELPGDAALETLRPPLFWGRDPEDPVIPPSAIERTAAWLPSHTTLTTRQYSGVYHSISREEIDDIVAFLGATRA